MILLLLVILINFLGGIILEKKRNVLYLILFVGVDLAILMYFKYGSFIYDNYSWIMKHINPCFSAVEISILLPVGISFYIFQALSYVIDVYSGKVKAQKSVSKFALYISLFPQLIAGPIVRYKTIQDEIKQRSTSMEDVWEGSQRFILGLGKKVLIADILAVSVDKIYGIEQSQLTTLLAWIAAVLYSLQIYYDFSGYSDMAIGLGRIMGFHFDENFLMPYTSENLTVFWRRWHISLSSFLKDYVYIPLGGNRKGAFRTGVNLIIVFLLCGLWHGSAWHYVIWGIYHGLFLLVERVLRSKLNFSMKGIVGHIVTFIIVTIGWVLFRSNTTAEALRFVQIMFGAQNLTTRFQYYTIQYYFPLKVAAIAAIGFIGSFFSFSLVRERVRKSKLCGVAMVITLLICMAYLSDASFSPFIYFQF